MTKAEIQHLAREAGLPDPMVFYAGYERFTNLVAAAEREECAKLCESRQTPGTGSVAILNGAADAIRARGTI